jgi:hypothetical protein
VGKNNASQILQKQIHFFDRPQPKKRSYFSVHLFFVFAVLGLLILDSVFSGISWHKQQKQRVTSTFPLFVISRQYALTPTPLAADLAVSAYTKIPGTDVELKLPHSYMQRQNSEDSFLPVDHLITVRTDIAQQQLDYMACQDKLWDKPLWKGNPRLAPYINRSYCDSFLTSLSASASSTMGYPHLVPNANTFYVAEVATSSSPMEWLLDNYHPQAMDLRKYPSSAPEEHKIVLGSATFFGYRLGCCGGGENVYVYPYLFHTSHLLLLFINEDVLPSLQLPDLFLNGVLSTLRTVPS